MYSSYINTVRISVAFPNDMESIHSAQQNQATLYCWPENETLHRRPGDAAGGELLPPSALAPAGHLTFGGRALAHCPPHRPAEARSAAGRRGMGLQSLRPRGSQIWHGPSAHTAVMVPNSGGYRAPALPCIQAQQKGLALPGEADWWWAGAKIANRNVWQDRCTAGSVLAVGSDTPEPHSSRSKPEKTPAWLLIP